MGASDETVARSLRGRVLRTGLDQLVRRGLRGVWTRGALVPSPVIWAANHHSWWDAFVASSVLRQQGRGAALLMDGGNAARFTFLADLGVVPTQHLRTALAAVNRGDVLVVYPEGELRTPGALGPLAPGAAWLARQGPARIAPVAVRVVMRAQQYPEAFVDIGPPCDPTALADALGGGLKQLDHELAETDPVRVPDGFVRAVPGRRSWDERLTAWSDRRGRSR